jgi:hypothetical protein
MRLLLRSPHYDDSLFASGGFVRRIEKDCGMRLFIPLAALLLPVAPLLADTVPPAAATKLDPRDPNAVKCRRLEATGSLIRKERVCKTNAEWRAISEQQNRDADNLIERSRAGMDCRAPGGGC